MPRGRGGSTTCRGSAPDAQSGREVGPHDRAEVADDRHPPRGRARCRLAGRKRRAQDPGPAAVDGHVRGSLARQPALGQQRPRAPAGMEQRREAVVAGLRRAQRGWVVAPLVVGAIALEPGAGAARCPPRRRIGARAGLAQRDAVIGREHLDGAPRSQRQRQPLRCQHVPAALAGRRGEALPHRGAGDGRRRGGAPERRLQDAPPAALDRQRERRRVLRDGRSERASGERTVQWSAWSPGAAARESAAAATRARQAATTGRATRLRRRAGDGSERCSSIAGRGG